MLRVLSNLPSYGPPAVSFPTDGTGHHKEGYVIEFEDEQGEKWVGNFQKGMTSFSNVFADLGHDSVFVVAGGAGYKINVNSRSCSEETGVVIDWCLALLDQSILVLSHGVDFEAINKDGRVWVSERISWDGFSELSYCEGKIYGKAYSPIDGDQHPFELDVTDGSFVGGSYNGP